MKLFELIEPKISSADIYRSNNGLKRVQNQIRHSKNTDFLGKGEYGQAVGLKARPGAVIKTGLVGDLDGDGYYRYISTIAKHKWASSNPYFPRVYSIKTYNNEDGDDMYVAEIEKLQPLTKVDAETIKAIGNRAFFNFEQETNSDLRQMYGFTQGRPKTKQGTPVNKRQPKLDTISQGRLSDVLNKDRSIVADPQDHKNEVADSGMTNLSYLITNAMKEKDMSMIRDPLLKQALMVIKKLNQRGIDTHTGNFMVRHGPGGGQLVITDPLL